MSSRTSLFLVPCILFLSLLLVGPKLNFVVASDVHPDELRRQMVARIDDLLQARWKEAGIQPSEKSTDAEFLRRVYLDLTGVVPRVADVRAFLEDQTPDKRAKLVDHLLESPGHATHLANTWRSLMIPGGIDAEQFRNIAGVQNWLRGQFVSNLRYDRIVSDFLVATGGGDTGPALYYTSLELKPEKLAASTARIFLGLQIECAECHDHPFDHWKQRDFWGYAAYFARLGRGDGDGPMLNVSLIDSDKGEVKLPGTEELVAPRFPGSLSSSIDTDGSRRVQLAIWMASRDNPYLAKAAVNRSWSQLFGRGLVEPVDDLSANNHPSHPELFDELARYFVRVGFDLRELYRTLTGTQAYQLSSQTSGGPSPPELFSAMAMKPLSAEQLYDSLIRVSGRRGAPGPNPFGVAAGRLFDQQRIVFIGKMESRGRSSTEYQAGVPQALTMMNGMEISQITGTQGELFAALGSDLFDDRGRVETLFLSALARFPSPKELETCITHVQAAATENEPADRRLGDILWALLNSAEFQLNH